MSSYIGWRKLVCRSPHTQSMMAVFKLKKMRTCYHWRTVECPPPEICTKCFCFVMKQKLCFLSRSVIGYCFFFPSCSGKVQIQCTRQVNERNTEHIVMGSHQLWHPPYADPEYSVVITTLMWCGTNYTKHLWKEVLTWWPRDMLVITAHWFRMSNCATTV